LARAEIAHANVLFHENFPNGFANDAERKVTLAFPPGLRVIMLWSIVV